MFNTTFKRTAVAAAIAMGLAGSAVAQETSSSLRGVVTTESGQVVSNATIQLRDERTGSVKTLRSNEQGTFSSRGLPVGGPYTLVVEGPEGRTQVVEDVYLTLGDSQNVNVMLERQADMERLSVTGSMTSNALYGSNSPAANFNLEDLENAPAANRDLKDVVRIDPRIYINETNAGDIQCGGANPRFNSLTVDGVRMNDNFGLNSSGYPTERMPFSYDSIEQVAVEFAPFDVQYGGFTACNINAVTKTGDNEMFGGVFYDYTNDSLQGDELEGDTINIGDFSEKRYGFNVGGAFIEDKLFFFTSYEKLEGSDTFDRGPEGSGAATEVAGVTQADVERIADIAQNIYGYNPGGFPSSLPVEDEKFLAKLDWYISDAHRASLTYNYNDGYSIAESDGDSDELEFSNHFYERGSKFTSYVGELYSDWNDNFSTEARVGYSELDARVSPLGGTDFGEVQIGVNDATVYLGADDSRHANKLKYDTTFFKLKGTYLLGDHVISAGIEREEYDVFNLFVQEAEGEYRFGSIDDFEAGTPYAAIYESAAGTNNPQDAAAEFAYAVNTAYVQDEYYYASMDITFTYGLRYDWYTSDDYPVNNPLTQELYGFSNQQNMDGQDLLQPRFGFNWFVNPELEVRGGVGLYSGGNPNVWISNNYSNNGVTQYQAFRDFSGESLFGVPHTGDGNPIFDIPQEMYDEVANASGQGPINTMDPNFELPKEWKYALGATYTLPDDYILMADFLYTDKKDAAIIYNLGLEQVDTAPDGRPIFDEMSTDGRDQGDDFLLTNVDGDSGSQTTVSLALSKSHDFGLDWTFGYAYNKAEDVNPMTSSVSFSNYTNLATANAQNPGVATSNYEIPHRFTFKANYTKEFFDGYNTVVTLFGTRNKGRPFSYTMTDGAFGDIAYQGRSLLYVPTGLDDPNFAIGTDGDGNPFETGAFFDFLEESGLSKYAGGIAPRNEFNSKWWTKVDLRIEQELPGFMDDHKASAFFVIENLGNMLNDDWGVLYEASFPRAVTVADVEINDAGQYQYNSFRDISNVQSRAGAPSLWSVRLGVEYKF
jgi:hypothetical protein